MLQFLLAPEKNSWEFYRTTGIKELMQKLNSSLLLFSYSYKIVKRKK